VCIIGFIIKYYKNLFFPSSKILIWIVNFYPLLEFKTKKKIFFLVLFITQLYRKEQYNLDEVKKLFAFGLEKIVSFYYIMFSSFDQFLSTR